MNARIYPSAKTAIIRDVDRLFIMNESSPVPAEASEGEIYVLETQGLQFEQSHEIDANSFEEIYRELEIEILASRSRYYVINVMDPVLPADIRRECMGFLDQYLANERLLPMLAKFHEVKVPVEADLTGARKIASVMAANRALKFLAKMTQAGKSVSFTGHRPDVLGGYDKTSGVNQQVCAFLKSVVERLRDEGYEEFISGAALGVDQWAADAVLELGLKLTIALPFKDYGENWPADSQRYLAEQKTKATRIVVVCEGEYQPWKNHKRNEWMSDNSDIVVAVWNGNKEGGTASAVRYNKKKGKKMIRFNPLTCLEEPI